MDVVRAELSVRARAAVGAVCLAAALVAGCDRASGEETRQAPSLPTTEGGSPVGLDSALKLFKVGLEPIVELENGDASIDALVDRLFAAVERSDTATLRDLVMSRREYAYLYYPTSPFTRAPTKQEPGLAWFLHVQNSQKGVTRLLERYGGKRPTLIDNRCSAPARLEGQNVLWDDCVQRLLEGRDTVVLRLFGGIYERNRRFKIFSYSNDL